VVVFVGHFGFSLHGSECDAAHIELPPHAFAKPGANRPARSCRASRHGEFQNLCRSLRPVGRRRYGFAYATWRHTGEGPSVPIATSMVRPENGSPRKFAALVCSVVLRAYPMRPSSACARLDVPQTGEIAIACSTMPAWMPHGFFKYLRVAVWRAQGGVVDERSCRGQRQFGVARNGADSWQYQQLVSFSAVPAQCCGRNLVFLVTSTLLAHLSRRSAIHADEDTMPIAGRTLPMKFNQ
jgi:hypothetical protein